MKLKWNKNSHFIPVEGSVGSKEDDVVVWSVSVVDFVCKFVPVVRDDGLVNFVVLVTALGLVFVVIGKAVTVVVLISDEPIQLKNDW